MTPTPGKAGRLFAWRDEMRHEDNTSTDDETVSALRDKVKSLETVVKKADHLLIHAQRAHRLGAQTGSHWVHLGAAISTYKDVRQKV